MEFLLELALVVPLILAVLFLLFKNRKLSAHLDELDYKTRAYEEILNRSADIVWLKDTDLRLQFVNEAYTKLFPDVDNFIGLTDEDLADKFLADGYRRDDEHVISTGQDYRYQENDKGDVWFETVKIPVKNDNDTVVGCAGIAHDITDRKERELKTYEMEHIDNLTGLGNRQALVSGYPETLAQALAEDVETYMIMLSVDNFKMINASYGFNCGDEVLRQLSFRLRAFAKNLKSRIARVGGDEFCLVIENSKGKVNISETVENLRRALGEPLDVGGNSVVV